MRIAIVDDNIQDRAMIESCLNQYFLEESKTYSTQIFQDALSFLADYHYDFDFIILDIDMPGINGMEAAKQLRQKDPNVTLMFVTNMPQYAIDAYAVEAMDYVLKPVNYQDFKLKMKKAERYIARNTDAPYVIHAKEATIRCMISDILYIESQRHYLFYHTKANVYKERGKLSTIAEALKPYHFANSSESYLINLSHLTAIEGNDAIVNKERIPISRRYKTSFLSSFAKYFGGFQ